MSKIDYEIRENGNACMFTAESETELVDTFMLLDEYPYIDNAMNKENYHLKNGLCHIFNEIVFEDKVVGFATYDIINNFELIMTECYILPEFRGNRLFFDELCKMHFLTPNFGILQPTRNVIELLLSYAFAKYATDNIVVSGIGLYLDPIQIKSNKRDGLLNLQVPASHFYDTSVCSTLFVYEGEVFYHGLLENDRLQDHNRKKFDKKYFSNILKLFSKNREEFENLISQLKAELPDNRLGYDVIVGHGSGLSEYMQGMVDEGMLSYEKAVMIRQQLIKEYESGQIDDSSIDERFNKLSLSQYMVINNFEDLRKLVDSGEIDDFDESGYLKELVSMVGDNDELGNELFNAFVKGNMEEFSETLINHLQSEEFLMDSIDSLSEDFDPKEFYESEKDFTKETLEAKYRLKNGGSDECPESFELEFYMILDALDYGDNYYDASDITMDSLVPIEFLTNRLEDSKFIRKEGIIEIDWINGDMSNYPDNYLKNVLFQNGLDYDGTRQELLKRLADNNVSLGDDYRITPEGKNFLKKHSWIGFYYEFLNEFDFTDFHRYLEGHKGNLKEIALKYLDEHAEIARKHDDWDYSYECSDARESILDEADEFIIGLNNRE